MLGELGSDDESAVPELIEIIRQDISPSSECCAILALSCVGPRAQKDVPLLQELLTSAQDASVRFCVTNAICSIDPEAAAKAGIK